MGSPADGGRTRVFFVHIMKTGGTTVLYHALRTLDRSAVWGPTFKEDLQDVHRQLDRYTSVRQIWAMGDWQVRTYDLIIGHYPWVATELVDQTVVTATLLRDPVERTVSYLRHCKQRHAVHADLPLEEIYEDAWHVACFVRDHQTKMMSMTMDEALYRRPPEAPTPEKVAYARALLQEGSLPPGMFLFEAVDPPLSRPLEMDRDRLAVALANLERVEVLGVQERHDEWMARLTRRAGWADRTATVRNRSESGDVSASFRRRIEADNALDVELYARACELVDAAAR